MHNFTRECQSHWRKIFLPHIRCVATIPCESLRHTSNTFHTILVLCTRLYRSHLGEPVLMKQTKHSRKRLKIYIQNVHHSCEHTHSNDYTTAKSLLLWWWCGPAASTRSADVLLFKSGKLDVHNSGGINSGISLFAAWWQCLVHGEQHDFSDVNIMLLGKECTWHAT